MALKYSRQREMIKNFLTGRKDHPTADTVYVNVRKNYPNISLGTVYRNLQLLSDIGEIQKVNVGDGVDHFDADVSIHSHFICKKCGAVTDFSSQGMKKASSKDFPEFDGTIEGSVTYYYGICPRCK